MTDQKEIQDYFNQKKDLHKVLLEFIDSENNDRMQELFDIINAQKMFENLDEIRVLLGMISTISSNHHRTPDFYDKIEKILSQYAKEIKDHLASTEIFSIFRDNKRILLFLFEQNFIKIEDHLNDILILTYKNFPHYFFPEIESILDQTQKDKIKEELKNIDSSKFNDFRKKGENDTYICSLIRSDSIEDFISHVAKNNIPFSSTITQSIFETNPFLLKQEDTTLIEYSAFFGSIQIFNYLLKNDAKLNPEIWFYAIHGKNSEIIQLLEEKLSKPNDKKYLVESIKCHHNEIASYILDNYLINEEENVQNLEDSCDYLCFQYYNFDFMPENIATNKFILHYLCCFSYTNLVKILLQDNNVNISLKVRYKDEIYFNLFMYIHLFILPLIIMILKLLIFF